MRRKDKEITDRATIDAILREAAICHVAMICENRPYVVPMNFGYDGRAIYLHSAASGTKIDALRANPQVCVQAGCGMELIRGETACAHTMRYKSVIANGRAVFLDEIEDKRSALICIASKYAGALATEFPDAALQRIALLRVEIETISGKQSPAR